MREQLKDDTYHKENINLSDVLLITLFMEYIYGHVIKKYILTLFLLRTPTILHKFLKNVVQIDFHCHPQKILDFYCESKSILIKETLANLDATAQPDSQVDSWWI